MKTIVLAAVAALFVSGAAFAAQVDTTEPTELPTFTLEEVQDMVRHSPCVAELPEDRPALPQPPIPDLADADIGASLTGGMGDTLPQVDLMPLVSQLMRLTVTQMMAQAAHDLPTGQYVGRWPGETYRGHPTGPAIDTDCPGQ